MSDVDIRIKQLAVTLTRDTDWRQTCDYGKVREAMVYIGLRLDWAQANCFLHYSYDPVDLSKLLNVLNDGALLALFLTEMLRSGVRPSNIEAFRTHLQPLGLDWDTEGDMIRPTSPTHPEAEAELTTELGSLLSSVNETFPNMLKGA